MTVPDTTTPPAQDPVQPFLALLSPPPQPPQDPLPELFFAIARPQGTHDQLFRDYLVDDALGGYGFHVEEVKLSGHIDSFLAAVDSLDNTAALTRDRGFARTKGLMQEGDRLRSENSPSIVAKFAAVDILHRRSSAHDAARHDNKRGVAYLIRSLVHPLEVDYLRWLYGSRFFLLGAYESFSAREERLKEAFAKSLSAQDPDAVAKQQAEEIINIDRGKLHTLYNDEACLDITATFHHADLFLDLENSPDVAEPSPDNWKSQTERFLQQVFGYPYGSPTLAELGMSAAYAAARRSVQLGRSVGAAIVSPHGQILSTGWNEVPVPGGGVADHNDGPHLREHHGKAQADPADARKLDAIRDFLAALLVQNPPDFTRQPGEPESAGVEEFNNARRQLSDARSTSVTMDWLDSVRAATSHIGSPTIEDIKSLALVPAVRKTRLFNLIEFGATVHAEMAAITSAARHGIAIQDHAMYVTTFPCHECARNIVAAGISRVVYIEPYSKSLAWSLYPKQILFLSADSRNTSGSHRSDLVVFEQFTGISPSRHAELFSPVKRKDDLERCAIDRNLAPGAVSGFHRVNANLRNSIVSRGAAPREPSWIICQSMALEAMALPDLQKLWDEALQSRSIGTGQPGNPSPNGPDKGGGARPTSE